MAKGETSNFIQVESGVPQGSVLEPSLYYVNDMPENIRSKTRLFADDTIVYPTITSDIDRMSLQDDLNKLAEWQQRK